MEKISQVDNNISLPRIIRRDEEDLLILERVNYFTLLILYYEL
jgi:hypothetical protein